MVVEGFSSLWVTPFSGKVILGYVTTLAEQEPMNK